MPRRWLPHVDSGLCVHTWSYTLVKYIHTHECARVHAHVHMLTQMCDDMFQLLASHNLESPGRTVSVRNDPGQVGPGVGL